MSKIAYVNAQRMHLILMVLLVFHATSPNILISKIKNANLVQTTKHTIQLLPAAFIVLVKDPF